MKKQLFLMAALGGVLMSANDVNAQETTDVVVEESTFAVEQVQCKDIYTPGSWRDNWYISSAQACAPRLWNRAPRNAA